MQWSIEQGKKKRRAPTEEQRAFLANVPPLDAGGFELARAYAQLSTCRAVGTGGIGPIPITAVWQWLDRAGIRDPIVLRHCEAVISHIDAMTLRRANRPTAKDTSQSPGGGLPISNRSGRKPSAKRE